MQQTFYVGRTLLPVSTPGFCYSLILAEYLFSRRQSDVGAWVLLIKEACSAVPLPRPLVLSRRQRKCAPRLWENKGNPLTCNLVPLKPGREKVADDLAGPSPE